MLSDMYDEYSAAEVAGLGAEMERIIDDLQTIPDDLVIEPMPTVKVTFDSRTESTYYRIAKNFGNLKITDLKMSLEPKIPPMTALDVSTDISNLEQSNKKHLIDDGSYIALFYSHVTPSLPQSDDEEDLLPIDNSGLSTLVKEKVALMA